jgi:hypothetical protein
MPETAAFRGWNARDAIEWFHGIGRLVFVHSTAADNSAVRRLTELITRLRERKVLAPAILILKSEGAASEKVERCRQKQTIGRRQHSSGSGWTINCTDLVAAYAIAATASLPLLTS